MSEQDNSQDTSTEKEAVYETPTRTGDWMGRSLFLGKYNTYFYKDLLEFLLQGKPTRFLWGAGALATLIFGLLLGMLASRFTSTLSPGYGFISFILIFGTSVYMAYLVVMPSDDTNLFLDSLQSFIYTVKRRPSFRGMKMGYELSEDETYLISKDKKDAVQVWLINGNINKSSLPQYVNDIMKDQTRNRMLLGSADVFITAEKERTTFEENKAYLNSLIESDLPELSKMLARYEKKHFHSNLEGEVARRSVMTILTSVKDMEKAQSYVRDLLLDDVISSYELMTGDRLRRYLDSL